MNGADDDEPADARAAQAFVRSLVSPAQALAATANSA